jgi:hypothetical protein
MSTKRLKRFHAFYVNKFSCYSIARLRMLAHDRAIECVDMSRDDLVQRLAAHESGAMLAKFIAVQG